LAALGAAAAIRALSEAGWKEAVVLSTCNRFEAYAVSEDGRGAEDLARFLDRFAGAELAAHAYRREGGQALEHLFSVAAGLDSLVLGEAEILGQVKQAYEAALDAGATGRETNTAFQRALYVGKAVRTKTMIGMGQVSVASVAVELAKRIFGRLSESAVLILGAGEMAEKTARHLVSAKVPRLLLANRTRKRALQLAESLSSDVSVEIVPWERFPEAMSRADVVVASTGAPEAVVTREHAAAAAAARGGRSLFLIDIAMPRDVAQGVEEIDGVYLYTMADMQAIVDENVARRAREVAAARAIVAAEAGEFLARQAGRPRVREEAPEVPAAVSASEAG
jgi:glutamyl-tRNA reductase